MTTTFRRYKFEYKGELLEFMLPEGKIRIFKKFIKEANIKINIQRSIIVRIVETATLMGYMVHELKDKRK